MEAGEPIRKPRIVQHGMWSEVAGERTPWHRNAYGHWTPYPPGRVHRGEIPAEVG
jgi:hypothetical protein